MALRRRQRLLYILAVLLPLCVGCLLAPPEASQGRSRASSPPPPAGQARTPVMPAQSPPEIAGCSVFPADNIWNVPVDTLPVDPNSDLYIATIGAEVGLHPDFGSGLWEGGPIGIPYVDVPASQPGVPVSFEYDDESDPGLYPIPGDAPIEGGPDGDGDRHVLVVERDNCMLYELFDAHPQDDGSWEAGSGAIFDLNSHALRPDGWTSADAAGLPILPGLVRYEEVAAGEIRHALRFTVPQTRRAYVWPARHFASRLTEEEYPPMGQRFRLKADFDMSGFAPEVQVILRGLQKYGMMLADNGSAWYISGVPDERWDNEVLRQLRQVRGSDFEAVDVSSLMVDPDSGQARTGTGSEPRLYLPLVHRSPPVDAPTATATRELAASPTATAEATATATTEATAEASPTATTSPTMSATSPTPTATLTRTSTATRTPATSPTATRTPATSPTATRTAIAADLFVDDDNTTGDEDGSARNPYNTVREAIDAASAGDVIAVAAGTYPENVRVQDRAVSLYGGHVGGTESGYARGDVGDFSVRDPAANPSHLQGDGEDSVVTLVEAGKSIVDGFRITGGSRSVETIEYCCSGGGFYVSGGAPTISNNVIDNNNTRTAAGSTDLAQVVGGGIFAAEADISILDNLIRNNTSGKGGGIALCGGTVVIRGNTVQGNVGLSDHGGGLYICATDAEISHNRIVGNEIGREVGYGWGGGILVFDPDAGSPNAATLSYNIITANIAPSVGSGVFVDDGASVTMEHDLVYDNQCTEQGGVAIYVDGVGGGGAGSTLSVNHVTITGHDCETSLGGNAFYVESDSDVIIRNSILWGNGGDDVIEVDPASEVRATYTLSEEELPGTGNLSENPLFADPAGQDHHLRSTEGRWDPEANGWVQDDENSPAIDAGDPASPFAAEPEPNGGRANMGAYGNTSEASKSAP